MPSPGGGPLILSQLGGGAPDAHALGGALHTADSLANLNSKITDATLIDTGDSRLSDARTPTAHLLGGAEHTADTLGNLNLKVSDATLVDSAAVMLLDGSQAMTGTISLLAANIAQIAGAEPVSNVTGLDSRKIGFEARLWDGAAVVTRTGTLRFEDISGTDDQGRFTLSADDNGGSDTDFAFFWRDSFSGFNIRAAGALIIRRGNGSGWLNLASAGDATLNINTGMNDDVQLFAGSGVDYIWVYETINQTNNTLLWGTQGTEGNTVVFTDKARLTLDHVVGTPATPTWRYHDGSVTVGNFGSITHDGTNLSIVVNAGALKVTGNIIPEADGTRSVGISTAAYGIGWFRSIQADSGQNLDLLHSTGVLKLRIVDSTGEIEFHNDGVPNTTGARSWGTQGAAWLRTVSNFLQAPTATSLILEDAGGVDRITIAADGDIVMNPPNDLDLQVAATSRIKIDGTGIGFFTATPASKPTVTGSRGGNAALADLLTDLATLGLITDSSTA